MTALLIDRVKDPATIAAFNELLWQIPAQQDACQVTDLLKSLTVCLGCDASVFASFTRFDEKLESYRFLAACSPVWCQLYAERRWYAIDHFLNYARVHSEPRIADDIVAHSKGQIELAARGREYGFRSSVIVPFHSSAGRVRMGVLYIGSDKEHYFTPQSLVASKMYLRAIAHDIGEWWLDRIRTEMLTGAALTADDEDLLSYIYKQTSSKDIARMLNTTVNTVDKRIARIMMRLGVPNRQGAARVAYDLGILD